MDVELYFHAPGQFLDLFGRMAYKLYRGEVMQTQITIRDSNELEKEAADDENYFGFQNTTKKSCTTDLYDDCVYNILKRDMRENTEDNCTAPYVKDADKGIIKYLKDKGRMVSASTVLWSIPFEQEIYTELSGKG